jgi:hypothetical protein
MRIHGDGIHDQAKYEALAKFLEENDFLDKPVDVTKIQTNKYQ